jgi:hypothetical protein
MAPQPLPLRLTQPTHGPRPLTTVAILPTKMHKGVVGALGAMTVPDVLLRYASLWASEQLAIHASRLEQ